MRTSNNPLQTIVKLYPKIWEDRKKFKALLLDFYPEDKRSRNLLYISVEERVPNELIAAIDGNQEYETCYNHCKKRICNASGCSDELADSIVSLWINAFECEIEHHTQQLPSDMKLDDIGLSVRAYNCLIKAGYCYANELAEMSIDDLLCISGMGKKTAQEVYNAITSLYGSSCMEDLGIERSSLREHYFDSTTDEFEPSLRSYRALIRENIWHVGEIFSLTSKELFSIKNLGKKSAEDISDKLVSYALSIIKTENKEDTPEANALLAECFEKVCEFGSIKYAGILGVWYYSGRPGVKKDQKKALKYLISYYKFAKKYVTDGYMTEPSIKPFYRLGVLYIKKENKEEAYSVWKTIIDGLFMRIVQGEEIEKDIDDGRNLYCIGVCSYCESVCLTETDDETYTVKDFIHDYDLSYRALFEASLLGYSIDENELELPLHLDTYSALIYSGFENFSFSDLLDLDQMELLNKCDYFSINEDGSIKEYTEIAELLAEIAIEKQKNDDVQSYIKYMGAAVEYGYNKEYYWIGLYYYEISDYRDPIKAHFWLERFYNDTKSGKLDIEREDRLIIPFLSLGFVKYEIIENGDIENNSSNSNIAMGYIRESIDIALSNTSEITDNYSEMLDNLSEMFLNLGITLRQGAFTLYFKSYFLFSNTLISSDYVYGNKALTIAKELGNNFANELLETIPAEFSQVVDEYYNGDTDSNGR